MAELYDALREVKDELGQLTSTIQQEEDEIAALEVTLREEEAKNKYLLTKLAQLELTAQLAESECKLAAAKEESLASQIAGVKYEIEEVQKKVNKKELDVQQLADFFVLKEQEFKEVQNRNNECYKEIPCVKKYLEAEELCQTLSDTVAALTKELEELQAEYGPLPGEIPEVVQPSTTEQMQPTIEVIQHDSPAQQVTPELKGIQDILAKFAELAEENRLLKSRLERLEVANQGSFAPPAVQQSPVKEQVPPKDPVVSEADKYEVNIALEQPPLRPTAKKVSFLEPNTSKNNSGPTPVSKKVPNKLGNNFTVNRLKAPLKTGLTPLEKRPATSKKSPINADNTFLDLGGQEIDNDAPPMTSLDSPISFGGDNMMDFTLGTPDGSFF